MSTIKPLADTDKLAALALAWFYSLDPTAADDIERQAYAIYENRLFYRMAYWSLCHKLMSGELFYVDQAARWLSQEVTKLSQQANMDIDQIEPRTVLTEAL